ncbi:MAG: CatB-related O-acetyltransferase [Elusimicrobia bacterium]|nr:CatB-related O-acetyltransferase [Elusimicrobiota bacterium]
MLLDNARTAIGANLWYLLGYIIHSLRGVKLGPGVRVNPRARVAKGCSLTGTVVGRNVSIDAGSEINGGTIQSATIGRYCSIAQGVLIGPTEHDYTQFATSNRLVGPTPQPAAPVIEDDVWIGANAVILRGVRISKGAVVAAGAIVTRDVPPYTIVAGTPAKAIKKRFPTEAAEAEAVRKFLISAARARAFPGSSAQREAAI